MAFLTLDEVSGVDLEHYDPDLVDAHRQDTRGGEAIIPTILPHRDSYVCSPTKSLEPHTTWPQPKR